MTVGLRLEGERERGRRGGGNPLRRLSLGHVAVALAAILAFVANVAFLRANDETVPVVATGTALDAGQVVTAADLRLVEIKADASVMATLLTTTDGLEGRVVRRDLPAGVLVGRGDLLTEAAPDGLRSMAIPISPAHAAGGTVRVGDIVDIVDVSDEGAFYVVRGVPVLEVSEAASGALNVSAGDHVVVGLGEPDVLAVAEAIADGEIDLVVTTGAER